MKKIFIYFLLASGILLGSCSLDIQQEGYILDENVIETVADVELVIIGAYGQMPTYGQVTISSRITDDNRLATSNRGEGKQIHTWSINSGTDEASASWAGRFRPVLNVNKLFEIVDEIHAANDAEVLELQQYVAEGYAIRAFMHFELLRLYGDYNNLESPYGVPYIEQSGINTPVRLSVGDSFDKIEADLLMAYDLMPESFVDKFRFNKDAVTAALARLYLYKKDYDKAITYSSELIDEMELNTISTYADLWTDNDFTEVILASKKVAGDGSIGSIYTSSNGDVSFHPSNSIIDAVSIIPEDVRNDVIYQTSSKGELVVAKYLGTETNPGLNHIKMFRLSEQYLIRAEAYARNKELVKASDDVNTLRKNRISGYTDVAFNSQDLALQSILDERRLELAFEGHRWFDLRRYEQGISRPDEDVVLIPEYQELPADDARFKYLPIPQDEIFANDNMEQNKGF